MVEIQRPVFVSGENPGLTLYAPGTDRIAALASYWNCELSPWGVGHALILWLEPGNIATRIVGHGGVFTDNPALAQGLINTLTQYFPEFQGVPLAQLSCVEAACRHVFDGDTYQVVCQATETQVEIAWGNILDRKQVIWPQFPAGADTYDLMTIICPCGEGQIRLDGVRLEGGVQTERTAEGTTGSSAFLAFSETWIGPFTPSPTLNIEDESFDRR